MEGAGQGPARSFGRQVVIVTAKPHQTGASVRRQVDAQNLAEENGMRALMLQARDAAVKGDIGIGQNRGTAGAGDPGPMGEAVDALDIAREDARQRLMLGRQHIDRERAVLDETVMREGVAVDADQQRRRAVGDRAHRRGGQPVAPGRAVCGDQVHRRAKPAHAFAEVDLGRGQGHRHLLRHPARVWAPWPANSRRRSRRRPRVRRRSGTGRGGRSRPTGHRSGRCRRRPLRISPRS